MINVLNNFDYARKTNPKSAEIQLQLWPTVPVNIYQAKQRLLLLSGLQTAVKCANKEVKMENEYRGEGGR
jgi:hypothetical protein